MGNMYKPLFDLDQRDVQLEVNSYQPGLGLAWRQLFPLKYTPKFDLKGIEGDEGIPVSADRVAFSVSAPLKTRKKVGTWNGELHKISIGRIKDEKAINNYRDLKAIAAANPTDVATAQYLVDMVFDDIKFCNDGMDYRVEADSMRIGSSGQLAMSKTFDGEMASEDTINFNVPTDQFVGANTIWSNSATADGLGDIIAAQKQIAKKGVQKPMFAIMDQVAFDYLSSQTKTATRIASALAKATGLDVTTEVDIDGINAYMRKHNYPQILVIDPYVTIEDKDGKKHTEKPWNTNVVTLTPTAQLGWTYYKPVPIVNGTAAVQTQGTYYKITVSSDVDPMQEKTIGEAYVQPALINRASLVFLNTLKTTWNGGAS
jgi:hypothetical protein